MSDQKELDDLVERARQGKLKPLVLVYGDQHYLVRQAYDRLREAWVREDSRDFNCEQHDGARVEPQTVLDSLAIPPMLPGPKAVCINDAGFFASKANVGEMLQKAKDAWGGSEKGAALRELGRVLSLAEMTWDEAAQGGPEALSDALELEGAEAEAAKGPWLQEALALGAEQGQAASGGGDDGVLAEGLQAMLEQWNEGTVLICACSSADQRKRLTKLFLERGHVLSFKKSEKQAQAILSARPFLKKALEDRQLKSPLNLSERLLAAYGYDLGILERELDKLADFAWPATELSDAHLNAVGAPRPEENAFKLLDALGEQKLGVALDLVRRLAAEDAGAPYQLLGLVTAEVRKMLLLRTLMDEGKLPARGMSDNTSFRMQVHPRVGNELPPALAAWWKKTNVWNLYYALQRTKAFQAPQLHTLIRDLAQGDLRVKSGQCKATELLEELCVRFCGVREESIL